MFNFKLNDELNDNIDYTSLIRNIEMKNSSINLNNIENTGLNDTYLYIPKKVTYNKHRSTPEIPKRLFNLGSPNLHKRNYDENICLNKDIYKLLEFKHKKRTEVEITKNERCYYLFCCYSLKRQSTVDKAKIELISQAEVIIKKRTEIFEIWKNIDQIRLFKC